MKQLRPGASLNKCVCVFNSSGKVKRRTAKDQTLVNMSLLRLQKKKARLSEEAKKTQWKM